MPWDPEQYALFESWRRRPAHDLVAALPSLTPRTVVDLGCGAGHLARLLAGRWPDAEVLGVDNSPAMLERAQATPSPVRWQQADLRVWRPDRPVDLLISNAALHWLDGHEGLFPDLLRALAPGGVLAVQMPRNFEAPSHRLLYETAADGPWAERLAPVLRTAPVHAPETYTAGSPRSPADWTSGRRSISRFWTATIRSCNGRAAPRCSPSWTRWRARNWTPSWRPTAPG